MRFRTMAIGAGALLLALAGCGGGSHHGSSGGPTSGPVSDETRMASLDQISNAVEQAVENDASDAALASMIRNAPGIADSGASPGGTVWARFADGRLVIVSAPNDWNGPAPALVPPAAKRAIGRGIPQSRFAYVFDAFDDDPNFPSAASSVRDSLQAGGYNIASPNEPKNATVDNLLQVKNAAAFYICTHGGAVTSLPNSSLGEFTSVMTTTPVTKENDAKYRDDLQSDALNYMIQRPRKNGGVKVSVAKHYCFTRNFVLKHMTFANDSVAAVDSCNSFRLSDMAEALETKGAATVFGWSNTVRAGDSKAAFEYLFDRVTGRNGVDPAEDGGPQRPFDYVGVWHEMGPKHLNEFVGKDGAPTDLLTNEDAQGGLNPSIQSIGVEESLSQITLEGDFPHEPGTVQINGHNLEVVRWEPNSVVAKIPATGADSSGDVQVFYLGRKSNVVTITEWNGDIEYTYQDVGSLKEIVRAHVRFRADAHRFRMEAGGPLHPPISTFASAADSVGSYETSGTYSDDFETVTWSGSTSLEAPQNTGGPGLQFNGALYNGRMWFTLSFFKDKAKHVVRANKFGTETRDDGAVGLHGEQLFDADGSIGTTLGEDLVFPGGQRESTFLSELGGLVETHSTLKWSSFVPTHLPHHDSGW